MAFTEFTCRSGGSNLSAGSLDGSAEAATAPLVTYTNGGWNSGTGVFTPASGNPVTDGVAVGQWVSIYADGASAPTGFIARVTAVSSTTITLSTTAKAGTAPTTGGSGITAVVGGAWAGPSGTSGFPFNFVAAALTNAAGNYPRVNFKNDQTYSITAAVTHALVGPSVFQGYTTTFGDTGKAVIDGGTSGSSYVLLTMTNTSAYNVLLRDLELRNNGSSGWSDGLGLSGIVVCERVVVHDVRGSGIVGNNGTSYCIECEVYACNQSGFGAAAFSPLGSAFVCTRCVAHDNPGVSGFRGGASDFTCTDCISDSNGGRGFVQGSSNGMMFIRGCVAYGSGLAGVEQAQTSGVMIAENCIFAGGSTYGAVNYGGILRLINCAFWSNTSGPTSGQVDESGTVTLTSNPFVNPGATITSLADALAAFALNAKAGGGALLRGAGY